jgi:hypothetical protein
MGPLYDPINESVIPAVRIVAPGAPADSGIGHRFAAHEALAATAVRRDHELG